MMSSVKQLLSGILYRRTTVLSVSVETTRIAKPQETLNNSHRNYAFSRTVRKQCNALSNHYSDYLTSHERSKDKSASPVFGQQLFRTKSNSLERSLTCPRYFHATNNDLEKNNISGNSIGKPDSDQRNEKNVQSLIETWYYEVCPYGSLETVLPFKTEIRPLPPQEYPDMNKVIIQLYFDGDKESQIPDSHQLSQISDLYDLKVGFDKDKANMEISCDVTEGVKLPVMCILQVPLKSDLRVKMSDDQDVSIQKMESNTIAIESEKGNCHLNNIKCGSISVMCRAGNITSKATLLGNIQFHTGKSGNITADKLQGSNVTCETAIGSVAVKSLYAESAIFRSDAGGIHLGQCHGQLFMQADRSIFRIESLDGDLDIGLQSGSVEAHLSRHEKANIEVKTGDIALSFPEGVSTDLNLDCRAVTVSNIDAQFTETGQPHHKEGYIGRKGKALVNARTLSGTIHLKQLDWIQTTKLAFQNTDET